jgi:hypothetical protein
VTSDRLRGVAAVLAVLSLVAAAGAGVVALVVTSGGDDAASEASSASGWTTVQGRTGSEGAATYQVPGGDEWEIHDADFAVSYKDADGRPYASGHAASFYYGNDCVDGEEQVAAGWALLADEEPGGDLTAHATASARHWARGYGTGAGGLVAPTTEPVVDKVELGDGTPAVSARVILDMAVFDGPCLGGDAEVTVVSFRTGDGIKTLVAARYHGVTGGITDEVYDAILESVRPD